MSEENGELSRFRRELENEWRIGEELGMATPQHIKVFELVLLEMKFRADLETAIAVASRAAEWIKTRNPFCIDFAVVLCANASIDPPPSLWKEVAEVATRRIGGRIGAATSEKLKFETGKQATLTLVANLVHSGETLASACSKAAVWHSTIFAELKPLKASTIEKYYVQQWRAKGDHGGTKEQDFFARWDEYKDELSRQQWLIISNSIPDADDELKGNRR